MRFASSRIRRQAKICIAAFISSLLLAPCARATDKYFNYYAPVAFWSNAAGWGGSVPVDGDFPHYITQSNDFDLEFVYDYGGPAINFYALVINTLGRGELRFEIGPGKRLSTMREQYIGTDDHSHVIVIQTGGDNSAGASGIYLGNTPDTNAEYDFSGGTFDSTALHIGHPAGGRGGFVQTGGTAFAGDLIESGISGMVVSGASSLFQTYSVQMALDAAATNNYYSQLHVNNGGTMHVYTTNGLTAGNGYHNSASYVDVTGLPPAAPQMPPVISTLTVDGPTVTNGVDFTIGQYGAVNLASMDIDHAELTFNGGGSLTLGSAGSPSSLHIGSAATLSGAGNGTISGNVKNEGTVSVHTLDSYSSSINVVGDYSQIATSTLEFTHARLDHFQQNPAPLGKLAVSGNLSIAGNLVVSLDPTDQLPASGASFDILDWGTRSGTFGSVTLPALSIGLTWDVSQLYTTGTLSIAGQIGDANHDGFVDAADYVAIRKGLGTTYTQVDYDLWRTYFGETTGGGSGATLSHANVPEPAGFSLLLSCAFVALCGVWRSRKPAQCGVNRRTKSSQSERQIVG